MNIHSALLHGDLQEEAYMHPHLEFHSTQPRKVCRLDKSLHRLRQAPRCWFSKLSTVVHKFDIIQTYVDCSLFTYYVRDIFLVFLFMLMTY